MSRKLSEVVDELGLVRAEIAELQDRKKEYEQILKDSGEDEIEGRIYRATVSRFTQLKTAWKAIAEKLGASRQIITANTSEVDVERVNVVARKAA